MQIGFVHIATVRSGEVGGVARRLEQAGFDSVWIPEHPIIPQAVATPYPFGGELPEHYGRWLDPFVALSVAAAATRSIKLATGICLLPERETLVTAKAIASLDRCSGGRVLIGMGAGWLREESEILGVDFGTRWRRLREMSEAMRILWREEKPSYEGRHVRFPPVRSEPKPLQAGGPPLLLGGHGEKALARVARSYDGWCPIAQGPERFAREAEELRERTREAGRDPDALLLCPYVDPEEGRLSEATLAAYRDAGATRVVLFSQQMVEEIADGGTDRWIERTAPVVERARSL